MHKPDTILCNPIGQYPVLLAHDLSGTTPMMGNVHFYARRRHTLDNLMVPLQDRQVHQVLIVTLGQLEWVNIPEKDCELFGHALLGS